MCPAAGPRGCEFSITGRLTVYDISAPGPRSDPAGVRDQRRRELVSAHPRTLRIYEDEGLICPARTPTNIRLYSENDIRRVLWIRHLTHERGVNLAGVRILFELEERLGTRILEALYDEGVRTGGPLRTEPAPLAADPNPSPAIGTMTTERPRRRRPLRQHPTRTRQENLMAKRPSTPVEKDQPRLDAGIARAAARRAPRDGHLSGDDRAAPGGPREERRGAQRRGRRRRPDRARHPAPGGPGGHQRPVRAVHRRHAGQDRPGRPAPGRHGPGDRPGPVAPARASASAETEPYIARAIEELADDSRAGRRGPGAHAHGPGPDRAVRRQRRAGPAGGGRRRPQHHRARVCWPTWSPTAPT